MFDVLVDGIRAYLVWTGAVFGTAAVFGGVRLAWTGAAHLIRSRNM